ncbi:hypothetical protein E2986_08722 [Frieseomelitta varia]|uniref:Uncharacterized protein n=1 Tax=Frieseomelitta varia TaxID=561572 RepID=A0A833RPS9_9HYME|nr:hypothetical protein E2986_08722 [Frieseomelitta varia]
MSQCRRRANNFMDSISNFRKKTDNAEYSDIDSDTFSSMSQDSLIEIKNKSISNDITCNNRDSIILAGSSSKYSCVQNPSILCTSSSNSHVAPDLNKRIDLFQIGQLCNKVDDTKENNNPQDSLNNISNKLLSPIQKQIAVSQSNTNSNVNNNILNARSILDNTPSRKLPQLVSSISCTDINKEILYRNYEDKHVDIETNKFETMLCSLDNYFNQVQEVSQTQQILKRLSDKFVQSPENFTEKLLTIIEESVIHDDDNTNNTSAIDLSRLTTEFKKMCKFIEDETAPEWAPSPLPTPPYSQISISPACNKSIHIKSEKLCSPINTSVPVTPISGTDVIKRRFLAKISKCNSNKSIDNVDNVSSASFEHWEDQCNKLFPKEQEYSTPLRKSSSTSSLLSMSEIQNICEQQMASLNTSNELPKNKSEFNSSQLEELHDKSKDSLFNDISYSMKKNKRINQKSDSDKVIPNKFTNNCGMLDPDELEKTLMQDIAEKRRRCFNTARIITEINADPEITEIQKTMRIFANDNESNLLNDETKFLQTLVLQNSPITESNLKTPENSNLRHEETKISRKESVNIKKTNRRKYFVSPNVNSPLAKKQNIENEQKKESTRSKLFVTPGKIPSNNNCKKKTYFPDMNSPVKDTKVRHILKSPHAEGLYRLNYNTIMSPVGMYIRGTDMQLIKNVRAKTDHLLLTPVKQDVKALANRNSRQDITPKDINKIQRTTSLKINLSPKINTNKGQAHAIKTSENETTPKTHFVLPKVSYKLPSQVKVIKQNNSSKQGTRVGKLLETAQSKVVIRHEGRINSVQRKKSSTDNGIYKINYEPEDESIHIEAAARKTNFINKKNI